MLSRLLTDGVRTLRPHKGAEWRRVWDLAASVGNVSLPLRAQSWWLAFYTRLPYALQDLGVHYAAAAVQWLQPAPPAGYCSLTVCPQILPYLLCDAASIALALPAVAVPTDRSAGTLVHTGLHRRESVGARQRPTDALWAVCGGCLAGHSDSFASASSFEAYVGPACAAQRRALMPCRQVQQGLNQARRGDNWEQMRTPSW